MTTDIASIFAKDPLSLSDRNLTDMVDYYRDRRHQYQLGNKAAGKKQTEKQRKTEELADKTGIDISELLK